nr:hypothetical protein [Tanacetum cinerariifolium]
MYARHIYANFKKKWNGLHYKTLFWGATYSTLEVRFIEKMQLIKNIDPLAYDWLMERESKSWCRAFFQIDRSCATFKNKISESYHNAILFARDKPIITMLKDIRMYLMQRMVAINEKATTLADLICPSITKELEKLKYKQRYPRYPSRKERCSNYWEKGHNKVRCYNQIRPKPVVEKRKPDSQFADSYYADTARLNVDLGSVSVDPGSASVDQGSVSVDPGSISADLRSATSNDPISAASVDPRSNASDVHTFTRLLQSVEQHMNLIVEMIKAEKKLSK